MKKTLMIITAVVFVLGSPIGYAKGNAASGKTKAAVCAACHGADGNKPTGPDFPILAGQHVDYLKHALSDYKSGKRTANGERFNPNGLTAAHRNLPFGTKVQVTNIKTGKSVIVRINDRGPFIKNRVIDLSFGAAKVVGLNRSGIAKVKFRVMD